MQLDPPALRSIVLALLGRFGVTCASAALFAIALGVTLAPGTSQAAQSPPMATRCGS